MMLATALTFAIGCFALAFAANILRLVTAKTPTDRILAADTMVTNTIALLVLYGIKTASSVTFEAALLLAIMGFVSSVALARFLVRGRILP